MYVLPFRPPQRHSYLPPNVLQANAFPPKANVFQVKVNSTDPIVFYCAAASHCSNGMSGIVNPSTAITLSAYQANAKGKTTTVPPSVFGGAVVPKPADSTDNNGGGGGGYGNQPKGATGTTTRASLLAAAGALGLAMLMM